MSKRNYIKSNSVLKVHFSPSAKSRKHASVLLGAKPNTELRQLHSQLLAVSLSRDAGIDLCKVKISHTRQYHGKTGNKVTFRQYGYYRPASKYIYIQNLTPVRGQPLAPKTFLDTLLHEWMHHYDHEHLKLDSIHTSGFYQRLSNLKSLTEGF